jgi:macrolide transport system ATP-binding/permease protein
MCLFHSIAAGLQSLLRRKRTEQELDEELSAFLEMAAEEKTKRGMSREDALRAVRLERDSLDAAKELVWSARWESFVETCWCDLRFALRQWTRDFGLALTAVLILALGMGISVAIFGFVDAALLQPLPYAEPRRLMSVNESNIESPRWPLSYLDYLDWQKLNHSFSSLDIYSGAGFLLHTALGVEPVQAQRVSGGFFRTLGVRPLLGRDFYPDEDRIGGPNVVLLSYGGWQRYFNANRDVVGQTVDLDNDAYTIIGVLPREFSFAPSGNAEFWVPINNLSTHERVRAFYNFWGIGRLRDSVSVQSASVDMMAIAKRLQQEFGVTGRDLSASVVPLSEVIIGDVRPILLMLLGGAALLLLIACVNVASLVLVRSESRKREIAVRRTLGASRTRLVQQFATEGLLLAIFGSLTSLFVASWLMKLLSRIVPKDMVDNMPFLGTVALNSHTVAFTLSIALMASVLLSAAPIFRLSFERIQDGLDERGRASGQHWNRLGGRMITVELAVAVVLLTGAGLLGQSFYRLLHVQLGFDPNRLATLQVMAPDTSYRAEGQIVALHEEIARRISSLPGIESVGLTSMLPVQCNCPLDGFQIEGKPTRNEYNHVDERHISWKYLPALRARLLRGRFFSEGDNASTPGVAVINETLARQFFPGEEPIGQRITNDEGGKPSTWEIVGIIEDVREGPLDVPTAPTEYFPISQTADHYFNVAVRTRQDAASLLPELVRTLHQIDPNLGISNEMTMNEQIESTQMALLHQFSAWLVSGFAAIALILGVAGMYGVITYSVSQRTREIGIRMAMGAERRSVYGLVLRQAGFLTCVGLTVGLVCSVGVSLLMRSLLFGVSFWDPLTLACVAGLVGAGSIFASFMPAHRAASVNPVEALRAE